MTYSTEFPYEEVRLAVQSAENAKLPMSPENFQPVVRRITPADKVSQAAARNGFDATRDAVDVLADSMFDQSNGLDEMQRAAIADKLMPYLYGRQPKAPTLDEDPQSYAAIKDINERKMKLINKLNAVAGEKARLAIQPDDDQSSGNAP